MTKPVSKTRENRENQVRLVLGLHSAALPDFRETLQDFYINPRSKRNSKQKRNPDRWR